MSMCNNNCWGIHSKFNKILTMSMCSYMSLYRSIHSGPNTSFRFLSKSPCLVIHLNHVLRVFTYIYRSPQWFHLNQVVCSHASMSPSVEHPSELHHAQVQSTSPSVEASIWATRLVLDSLQLWTLDLCPQCTISICMWKFLLHIFIFTFWTCTSKPLEIFRTVR